MALHSWFKHGSPFDDVGEFNYAFGVIPEKKVAKLAGHAARAQALIDEEYGEYCDAANEVERADAICDLLYVAMGAMWRGGIPPDANAELAAAMAEKNPVRIIGAALAAGWFAGMDCGRLHATIHANNMEKLCRDEAHAEETAAWYRVHGGQYTDVACRPAPNMIHWVCYHVPSGKVLKALGWRPPKLD
jgi:predicted HAD superfamily Cof-like phosphohydrolase